MSTLDSNPVKSPNATTTENRTSTGVAPGAPTKSNGGSSSVFMSTDPILNGPNTWTNQDSADLYGINSWGSGYFRINESGNVSITPLGETGPKVDLMEL